MKITVRNSSEEARYTYIEVLGKQTRCKIALGFGGSLQAYIFNKQQIISGEAITVDGYKKYKTNYASAFLFPFANRVKGGRYTYGGKTYQLHLNEIRRKNAIHGHIAFRCFDIEKLEEHKDLAIIKIKKAMHPEEGFPFWYDLNITYKIYDKGSLEIEVKIVNTGNEKFPFTVGWHPYFKTEAIANSIINASSEASRIICDEHMIPIGREKYSLLNKTLGKIDFDDAFLLKDNTIYWKNDVYEIEMRHTGGENFFQLFTPDHRKSLAIEPMTATIDAFNNGEGLLELAPKENYIWTVHTQIKTSNEKNMDSAYSHKHYKLQD